ncbi:eukaryotic translation initiation factor 3 subunit K-like isoform X2 [Littorina saxatilis]|uniref:eukaryotic translation initiation factor 3 subunit K-like isoform X2 n=1 Tax=Littorina saxatilis TaxID=31220 RepID=UPI0038B5FE35
MAKSFARSPGYNPENLPTLERYVQMQAAENTYDIEANLAVLKLYQFNPGYFQTEIASLILLKALTNLPHTDFILCKCLIDTNRLNELPVSKILELSELLETCDFERFWAETRDDPDLISSIVGFEDSIRKFICHVVAATFQSIEMEKLQQVLGHVTPMVAAQWVNKYGWTTQSNGMIFVSNQEESIKTKNITEKITFDSVAAIMSSSR